MVTFYFSLSPVRRVQFEFHRILVNNLPNKSSDLFRNHFVFGPSFDDSTLSSTVSSIGFRSLASR